MFDRINIIIVLISAIVVTIFNIVAGNSLFHLAVCLIATIIVFSVIGYFVKWSLNKWFVTDEPEEEEGEFSEIPEEN